MGIRANKRQMVLNLLSASGKTILSRQDIASICSENSIPFPHWFTNDDSNRVSRGMFRVPSSAVVDMASSAQVIPLTKNTQSGNRISSVTTDLETEDLIQKAYDNYVPFGNFNDLVSIFKSNQFFPVFISGHSGNGKTMSVEQACAKTKRKFVCVSMTPDTDESDLLGNYVLINGQMEWRDGPVTVAARQGAVLHR